jgi:hypothetical protein
MCAKHSLGESVAFYIYPSNLIELHRPKTKEWFIQYNGTIENLDSVSFVATLKDDNGNIITDVPFWRPSPIINAWAYEESPFLKFWTCSVDYHITRPPNNS